VSTDSSCFVGPWSHFAVEALCSAVMGNPYAPMGDFEHMEARTVGVGWEKSVSAEPVQRGKGANLLLPGHALTGTVKDCGSTRPDPNSAAHVEARVSRTQRVWS